MISVTINNQNYRIGRLSALAQFHVSRRLGPVLAVTGSSLAGLKNASDLDFADILEPIMGIVASMPDADVDYILFTCLSVVTKQQGDAWAPVSVGNRLMFEDLDMPDMLRLVFQCLKENLGNFLKELDAVGNSPSS